MAVGETGYYSRFIIIQEKDNQEGKGRRENRTQETYNSKEPQ
jgi:hypothetical protein